MPGAEVTPIIEGAALKLDRMERNELYTVWQQHRTALNEWLRRQIVDNNRIDILASEVLGYTVKPFHLKMMQWQFQHPKSLQLSFRGAGKSTCCTITKAIHYIIKNRNIRILLGSEKKINAIGFLTSIKGHLEHNERLIEIFGKFYDPNIVPRWSDSEIVVVGRTEHQLGEATITCIGVDSRVTSKHFDVLLTDDLATEENSRTELMREKTKQWYYHTYRPLLLPPKEGFEHRGEHHHLGTKQHFNDLYGHLEENELKEHTQIIPALDEQDNSPWPDEFPVKFFREQRTEMGIIRFGCQYLCNADAMRGEIFQYDDCQEKSDKEYPSLEELKVYMGVDLSADEKEHKRNARFSIAVIGILGSIKKDDYYVYLLDYYDDHLRPTLQPDKVIEFYDRWKPIRTGIETNQYQNTLRLIVQEKRPNMSVKKIETKIDKITRAWKIAPIFENNRAFFRKGVHAKAIEQLVLFPAGKYKDFFDAYDHAITAARHRIKKKRKERPNVGLI